MSFLWPEMFWALLIIPVIVSLYIIMQRRRRKYVVRYASLLLIKQSMGRRVGVRRYIPPVLFIISLMIMVLALARPTATVIMPSQKSTVILTIDVSGSMRANDIKPSRLEAAKSAAKIFVEKQPKDVLIGVVSFSEAAFIVQPPTKDRNAILGAIGRLSLQRRTAIGSGILTSLDAIFEEPGKKPTPTSNDVLGLPESTPSIKPVPRGTYAPAVIVLLTDGQSNTGPHPLDVVMQALDRGVRIYTVGLGTPDGTTLDYYGFGMVVRLDEETLKRIAERTDGTYFRAGSETDLLKIYDNLGTQLVFTPEKTELTAWFTGLAALFLIIAVVLSLLWFNRLP
jgi:Ca-activated chloride channel homolog